MTAESLGHRVGCPAPPASSSIRTGLVEAICLDGPGSMGQLFIDRDPVLRENSTQADVSTRIVRGL